jgi:hypothetical protein
MNWSPTLLNIIGYRQNSVFTAKHPISISMPLNWCPDADKLKYFIKDRKNSKDIIIIIIISGLMEPILVKRFVFNTLVQCISIKGLTYDCMFEFQSCNYQCNSDVVKFRCNKYFFFKFIFYIIKTIYKYIYK